jgi:8-oxo-dGTP pyrophosphatase MutT (NUDIX family)
VPAPNAEPIVANPRPAATVVVLRDGPAGPEVFMVRRHEDTAFMGGAHVFPGGRVEDADGDANDTWCDGVRHAVHQLSGLPAAQAVAFHVAAARELFEEAGVLLARHRNGGYVSLAEPADHERLKLDRVRVHDGQETLRAVIEREGLRLALDALILFSHWVTPPIDSRQFDTRFFMARIPPDQTPAHDDTETTHSLWVRPADAIAQSMKGEITLPPPTWSTLRELEPFESVRGALAWARRRTVIRRMPKAIERDGHRMLLLPGDPLHPDPAGDDPPLETRFVLIDRRWRAERPPT